ncbi:MAG: AAA family ATPase [Oscillospiraceae bacterium]
MQIDRLSLRGFRNYEDAQAQFVPGVNLLVGGNANGKTNLLEAVSYLSTGRSFRTRREAELIRFGADFAELRAQVQSQSAHASCAPCCFRQAAAPAGSPGSGSAAAPPFPACSRACCSARRTL